MREREKTKKSPIKNDEFRFCFYWRLLHFFGFIVHLALFFLCFWVRVEIFYHFIGFLLDHWFV
jgi:hypothetical protein